MPIHTAGMMVKHPTSSGSPTRRSRCLISERSPRLRHSMAVKKPLIMKNSGIRKPCTKPTNTSSSQTPVSSSPRQGTNGMAACSPIPNSMAKLRNASRS